MASSSNGDSFADEACCQERKGKKTNKKKTSKKISYRKSLGVYQNELLVSGLGTRQYLFLSCMALVGALGHVKEWIPSELKEKQRSRGEAVEHKWKIWGTEPSGALPGQLSWASQHQDSAWVQTYKSPKEKAALPKFCFPRAVGGQLWPAWTDRPAHHCSSLERRGPVCSALLFLQLPQLFPGWPCTVTSVCPHTVLAASSPLLPPSSSSPELFCQDERLLSELHGVLW